MDRQGRFSGFARQTARPGICYGFDGRLSLALALTEALPFTSTLPLAALAEAAPFFVVDSPFEVAASAPEMAAEASLVRAAALAESLSITGLWFVVPATEAWVVSSALLAEVQRLLRCSSYSTHWRRHWLRQKQPWLRRGHRLKHCWLH